MANVNQQIQQKSNENAKKAKQLPPSTQYAIVTVMPNIMNGAFWGFDSIKNVQQHFQALSEDQNIVARKLANDCLLEVQPSYLLSVVQMIDSQAITQNDIENIKRKQSEAHLDFEKFLIRSGKKNGGFSGRIGIYCTNDTSVIKSKGVSYPAFRLNIAETLGYLGQYGYGVQVGNSIMTAQDAYNSGQAIWDSMELSPTKTGIFVNIQYLGTPDQMKQLEAAFKQKYGLK